MNTRQGALSRPLMIPINGDIDGLLVAIIIQNRLEHISVSSDILDLPSGNVFHGCPTAISHISPEKQPVLNISSKKKEKSVTLP